MKLATHNLKLLFIHGWATDSRIWKHQLKQFSNNYEVAAMDIPGHSEKDTWNKPSLKPAIDKIFRITHNASRTPPLSPPLLKGGLGGVAIGWSLGGQVLLEAAAQRPDYFKGLVLIGVSPCFTAKKDFPFGQSAGIAKRMLRDLRKDFTGTLEKFYPLNFTEKELLQPEAMWFSELYKSHTKPFRESAVTALEALLAIDLRDIIPDIKIPVLVIHGKKDNVCPVDAGRYLAKNLPDARIEIFKDSGHAPFLTKHKEFNSLIKGFLKGIIREGNE